MSDSYSFSDNAVSSRDSRIVRSNYGNRSENLGNRSDKAIATSTCLLGSIVICMRSTHMHTLSLSIGRVSRVKCRGRG